MGVKTQDIRRIREQNSCLVSTLTEPQMAGVRSSNCLVYLNRGTERGLIIPTVSRAWSLFILCHKSEAVSDSKGAFRGA